MGEFSYDIVTDVDLPKTSETLEFSSELEEGSSVKKSLKGEGPWSDDFDSDWNCLYDVGSDCNLCCNCRCSAVQGTTVHKQKERIND